MLEQYYFSYNLKASTLQFKTHSISKTIKLDKKIKYYQNFKI